MDGTNLGLQFPVFQVGFILIYRPAIVFTKLANDSDRTRIRLYTVSYMPPARQYSVQFVTQAR